MNYQLQLSDSAKADLTEIVLWYAGKSVGISEHFEMQVQSSLALLRHYPLAFGVIHKRVRKLNMSVFPYGIFYEIRKDCILVLAILHHSRYPRFGHN